MSTASWPRSATALPDERAIPKDAVIFRQGDTGNEMFVIGEGSVRLLITTEDGHESEIGIFGKGEFFGELSLMSAAPRSATAIAAEDSVLLVVTRDVFSMMVQDDLEIVARMMGAQGRRLSRANEPITQLTQQLGRVRVAAHAQRSLLTSASQTASFETASLARDLDVPQQAIASTIALLAQEGIGTLTNGNWALTAADISRLADAILRESEVGN